MTGRVRGRSHFVDQWRAHSSLTSRRRSCSARPRSQSCRDRCGLLGGGRRGIEAAGRAADGDFDCRGFRDRHLQRDPPQPAQSPRRNRWRHRGCRARQIRAAPEARVPVVAIAVVEGETGETARKVRVRNRPCASSMVITSMSRERRCDNMARRNSGATSRCRLGWNSPFPGGRTWCSMKIAPTPEKTGRNR